MHSGEAQLYMGLFYSGFNLHDQMFSKRNNVSIQGQESDALSGYFLVGDEMLTKEQYEALFGGTSNDSEVRRAAISNLASRWPKAASGSPTVHFEILSSISSTTRVLIHKAIREYRKKTCLSFVYATSGARIKFTSDCNNGCWSYVGKISDGGQTLCLGWCSERYGSIVHEIGHALGLWHEHQRPDRDQYIRIPKDRTGTNYARKSSQSVNTFGVPYDYLSIMHYPQGVVQTLDPSYQDKIGQRNELSYLDVQIINRMYECTAILTGM